MNNFADQYQTATEEFLKLANSLTESQLDISDNEGWTPRQVIHHMADSETQSYVRIRRLISEPGSIIQGYDEKKWAESPTLGYETSPIQEALAVIEAVRNSSLALLRKLSKEQLEIKGVHSESGEYSIQIWINTYMNHPKEHAQQIKNHISK